MTKYWVGVLVCLLTGWGCAPTPAEPVAATNSKLEIVTQQENWHAPSTTITLNFPRLTLANKPSAATAFNQAVEAQIKNYVKIFLAELENNDDLGLPPEEYVNFLEVSVYPRMNNDRVVSVVLAADTFLAGLAHPNRRTASFNFDLEQERVIVLKDLFVNDTPYLDRLASTTIAQLKKQPDAHGEMTDYDEDWLQGGAGPDERNYHTVSIAPEGLYVTFDPYDIGPYSGGSSEVLLTYDQLGEIISPQLKNWLN